MKIRRFSPFFMFFFIFIDIIICYIAIHIAWLIRFSIFKSPIDQVDNFVLSIMIPNICWYMIATCILLFYIFKLYQGFRQKSLLSEISKIFYALLVFLALLSLYFTFSGQFDSSKFYITILVPTLFILSSIERLLIRMILRIFRKKGYNSKFVIIIGINPLTRDFLTRINTTPSWGYKILGYFEGEPSQHLKSLPYLGNFDSCFNYIAKKSIDEIVISLDSNSEYLIPIIISACEKEGKQVKIIPSLYQYFPSVPKIEDILGLPMIQTRPFPLSSLVSRLVKRGFDILFSLISFVILSPFFIVISIMVKTSSPGPIFFKQMRTGFRGEEFYIYKFRSMKQNLEADTKVATENDPRKTKMGTFLRKYNLDELPQLLNILKGDMSFVGPRPHMVSQTKDFYDTYNNYLVRHWVNPGLTGWAQVNGLRGNSNIEKRLKFDIYYIENWSIFFDIQIIFLTLTKSFFDENAY